jgi:hypothetical protein
LTIFDCELKQIFFSFPLPEVNQKYLIVMMTELEDCVQRERAILIKVSRERVYSGNCPDAQRCWKLCAVSDTNFSFTRKQMERHGPWSSLWSLNIEVVLLSHFAHFPHLRGYET